MRRSALVLPVLLAFGCASIEGHRHFQAGNRALDRGDASVAVAELERAAALVPEASEVQNHLGIAYGAAGRDADALAAFERAVALDCDNQAAVANLEAARRRASVEALHSRTRDGSPPGQD